MNILKHIERKTEMGIASYTYYASMFLYQQPNLVCFCFLMSFYILRAAVMGTAQICILTLAHLERDKADE